MSKGDRKVDADRLFECLVLGGLGCLTVLGISRGMMLSARGVRIFTIDRERTKREGLADLAFLLCFVLWVYETASTEIGAARPGQSGLGNGTGLGEPAEFSTFRVARYSSRWSQDNFPQGRVNQAAGKADAPGAQA